MIELQLNKMTFAKFEWIDVLVYAKDTVTSDKSTVRLIKRYTFFDDKDYRVFLGYIYGSAEREYYLISYDNENHFVIRYDLGVFNEV